MKHVKPSDCRWRDLVARSGCGLDASGAYGIGNLASNRVFRTLLVNLLFGWVSSIGAGVQQ
jgi:hypothetical protein